MKSVGKGLRAFGGAKRHNDKLLLLMKCHFAPPKARRPFPTIFGSDALLSNFSERGFITIQKG